MSPSLEPLWREYLENGPRPARKELRETSHFYLERVTQALGIEFTDALTGAIDDQHEEDMQSAYAEGFLTAFRLWMEMSAGQGGG